MLTLKKIYKFSIVPSLLAIILLLTSCGGGSGLPPAPAPDREPPFVVNTEPANGSNTVSLSQIIKITFNEAFTFDTGMIEINAYLKTGILDQSRILSLNSIKPYEINGRELSIFIKDNELKQATRYRVHLHNVKDLEKNTMTNNCQWEFATSGYGAVDILNSGPCSQTSVPVGNLAGLEISEGILSPNFHAYSTAYSASVNFLTTVLNVKARAEYGDATILINGKKPVSLSADPNVKPGVNVDLLNGLNVISIVVTESSGVNKTYTLNITRESNTSVAPIITSVSPALKSTVATGTAVTLTFNVPMDSASFLGNIKLWEEEVYFAKEVTLNAIPFTYSTPSGITSTVTINTLAPLNPGRIYQVVVTSGVGIADAAIGIKSSNGDELAADFVTIFTTENGVIADAGGSGIWTWVNGDMNGSEANQYDGLSVIAPGYRYGHIVKTDSSGNAWMFGGNTTLTNIPSDLWKFDGSVWSVVWQGAASGIPKYGVKGKPAVTNDPSGDRYNHSGWMDINDNLWIFGGNTRQDFGVINYRNDLWKFDSNTLNWTWISGNDTSNKPSICVTLGAANIDNTPGARQGAASWTVKIPPAPAGNGTPAIPAYNEFWLFGGTVSAPGTTDLVEISNDLWMYNTWTSMWTCVRLSDPANVIPNPAAPLGREGASTWVDLTGNLWLYGGSGYTDLWRYNRVSNEWVLYNLAADIVGKPAYGIKGVAGTVANPNNPGRREYAMSWLDNGGNLWLAGGNYYHYAAKQYRYYSDMWKYDMSLFQWVWVRGSKLVDLPGNFGTQGVSVNSNYPNSRTDAASWTDKNGNFMMMGGVGTKSSAAGSNIFSDVWQYTP